MDNKKEPATVTLIKKGFALQLPAKGNSFQLLRNEETFVKRVLEIEGCCEVEGRPNICGIYSAMFDVERCPYTDEEIKDTIMAIADVIGYLPHKGKGIGHITID